MNTCSTVSVKKPKSELKELAAALASHPAILEKVRIKTAYSPAEEISGGVRIGDDCAAIEDPTTGGYLLFAAEGILESFVAEDPWFAGYSAVMVNLSDVAAMGGRPIAITNTLWSADNAACEEIWRGMRSASEAYGVPIVGGHTTRISEQSPAHLGASVMGRAGKQLLTSFDAKSGDHLVLAIDMEGAYRKDKPFWNASISAKPEHLRNCLELLPLLAERQLCRAAKDVSNGGIIGTLAMFCDCSDVGVEVDLDFLPRPPETSLLKWLISFPSFGYLLAVSEENLQETVSIFSEQGITAKKCGTFLKERGISLRSGKENEFIQFD